MNTQQANLNSPLKSKNNTKYKVTDKINSVGKLETVKSFSKDVNISSQRKKMKAKYNHCVPIVQNTQAQCYS